MLIYNERDLGIDPRDKEERDMDISVLNACSGIETIGDMYFVVTGSYAIEALSGTTLPHGDIDANIFTMSIREDLPRAAARIPEVISPYYQLATHPAVGNRLEYVISSRSGLGPVRKLEVQFVEFTGLSKDDPLELVLPSNTQTPVKVPTSMLPIRDSHGTEHIFRVKSLPYVVASWVLRISSSVSDPKREVRRSDVDHLRSLLERVQSLDDVERAMEHHPQMPLDKLSKQILKDALTMLLESKETA